MLINIDFIFSTIIIIIIIVVVVVVVVIVVFIAGEGSYREVSIFIRYRSNFLYDIYYFMLLEYVWKVSQVVNHPESNKIIIEKKIEREVKYEIPYATRKINYIFHHGK